MHADPVLLPLVAAVASILGLGLLLKAMHQPDLLGFLLAGILIGPSGFSLLSDLELINHLGAIGVSLLLFFIGMEVSIGQLVRGWKLAIPGTMLQVLLSVVCAWIIGQWFDWSTARIVLLGFVISLSSTAVVLKLLIDAGELNTPTGQDVLLILVTQDLAVVPMMILLGLLDGEAPDGTIMLLQLVGGSIFLGLAIWIVRGGEIRLPFADRLRRDHELQVFAALLICFGFATLSGAFQLSAALGAFVAGMFVSAARETDWVREKLEPFRTVFMAFFFVSIGMLIDVDFIIQHFASLVALMVAVILTNTVINAGILRVLGRSRRESLYAGALLSQIGEFSFVLAAIGFQAGIITNIGYQYTIAIIALSLLVSTSWIALVRRSLHR